MWRPSSASPPGRASVLLAGALTVAGCTDAARSGPPSATAEPGDAVVRLVGLDFEPRTVEVAPGTRVRWDWTDSVVHNVVSQEFASSKELNGGAHAVRFDRPGTFSYRCTLHTGMDGTVVVTP